MGRSVRPGKFRRTQRLDTFAVILCRTCDAHRRSSKQMDYGGMSAICMILVLIPVCNRFASGLHLVCMGFAWGLNSAGTSDRFQYFLFLGNFQQK